MEGQKIMRRWMRRSCLFFVIILALTALALGCVSLVSRHWVDYDGIANVEDRTIGLWRHCQHVPVTVTVTNATGQAVQRTQTLENCQSFKDIWDSAANDCLDGQEKWVMTVRALLLIAVVFTFLILIMAIAGAFVKKFTVMCSCAWGGCGLSLLATLCYALAFGFWIHVARKDYCSNTVKLMCQGDVQCEFGYALWLCMACGIIMLILTCMLVIAGFPRQQQLPPQQVVYQEQQAAPYVVTQPAAPQQVIYQEPAQQVVYQEVVQPTQQAEYVVVQQ